MTPACRVFGHRLQFQATGPTLTWSCRRCGEQSGAKRYPTAQAAERYATAFNRHDADDLGKRAPLIGLLPLRLWRKFRS